VTAAPEFSLVIPCYDEEPVLERSIPPLRSLLRERGLSFELVLVNNGSSDRTGEILAAWAEEDAEVVAVHLPRNQKYGGGVLAGQAVARGRIVCHLCADGQISEKDILQILLALRGKGPGTMAKAWRVTGHENPFRKFVSLVNRFLFRACFGQITRDVNATPKAIFRTDLETLALGCSSDFLDAEIMIKAHYLGLEIIEIPCAFLPRAGGVSKVSRNFLSHFAYYVAQLARFRLGGALDPWKEKMECRPATPSKTTSFS
jgi:glycosyltransferase involved in cell wall biosynthesis